MSRQLVHSGRKFQVWVETTQAADGSVITRDLVIHPGAVAILPLVDAEHVCLVRNYRATIGDTLVEIPAGTLETGEDPDRAAQRELAEETGYRAARWGKLGVFYPSPGVLSEQMHLYVASELTTGPMHLEKDEQLEPQVVPWSQLVKWAHDGTICDAKTLVAVLWWLSARTLRA
jgi:ADP-ribose pyrophosphatase